VNTPTKRYIFLFFIFCQFFLKSQDERIQKIESKLNELSNQIKGLKETVDFSVSGVSIQEFLRGIAETNNINISVDPSIDVKIYNNFNNESAANVLLFLCKEYNLDIRNIGTIISVIKYVPPQEAPKTIAAKEIIVNYNSYADLLTLDLKNDTLEVVVKKITQISKKNVIIANGLKNTIVNGYIENMPFDAALDKIAFANKLKILKTTDNFYVIKSLEDSDEILNVQENINKKKNKKKLATNNNFQNNGGFGNNNNASNEQSLEIEISDDTLKPKTITLEANNSSIGEIIKSVFEEMNESYFLYSEIKGNTSIRVKNVTLKELLSNLLNGTDYAYKLENKLYLIGERKLEGLRTYKVVQLHFRSLDLVQETIPSELKKGIEVKEFKELNSILLSGSALQIAEVEAFIKQIDKVVPMVLLEVTMMDIRKTKTISTGIKAGVDSTATTKGTLFPGLDATFSSKSINQFLSNIGVNNLFNIGKVAPSFYVTLKALEDNSNVEVRSMPKLSTLNGHDANLSIGSTRYYYVETQNTLGTLTTSTVKTRQWNPVEANLTINIKPMVSGDDQVTMELSVNISDFLENTGNDAPPASSKSQFKSIIRVKNEDMVILGGIERIGKSQSGSGVPILSRIPILKWIFSSRTKSKSKTISVVFVKPTIIY
jgi:type IV pilus assembly protein PilQ